jgi:hypothetical protein
MHYEAHLKSQTIYSHFFESNELDYDDTIVRREILPSGKSGLYNGPVNLQVLQELSLFFD